MLFIYLATLGFGAVLILVSLVAGAAGHGGGSQTEIGKPDGIPVPPQLEGGASADVAGETAIDKPDVHVPDKPDAGAIWAYIPITSIRFWSYAALAFGLVGVALEYAAIPGWIGFSAAAGTGVSIGWMAAQVFRRVLRDQVTGETDVSAFAGREGVVVIAVRPGGRGKVAVEGPGGRVELPATTRDTRALDRGVRVLITQVSANTAEITSIDPGGP